MQWGGKIVVGTDPTGNGRTIAGYANQRMIELLIETGFTLEEAINIATLKGAIYLELAKETGSLEAGKLADLVLINVDLQKDISKIRDMEIVFKDGVGYSSKKIFDSVKGKIGLIKKITIIKIIKAFCESTCHHNHRHTQPLHQVPLNHSTSVWLNLDLNLFIQCVSKSAGHCIINEQYRSFFHTINNDSHNVI